MRIALYSSQVSTPPPPPPPPPHKVQAGETVQSVAKVYHVTPQALAHTNHITVDATLHAGQVLQLPANAFVTEVPAPDGGGPQTPQQKTDAAAKAYQQALKDRDRVMADAPRNMGMRNGVSNAQNLNVDKARAAFDAAVQAEINGRVADANQGVPGEYRTPTDQLVKTYGDQVVARYAGDPNLKTETQAAVHATQVQTEAGSLIPGFAGSWTAAEKLQQIDLTGQSQEVVDAVMNDPRVQQWITQAAADVGKPLDGVGKDDLSTAVQAAGDASKLLADAATGMDPVLAAALVGKSMPTISKMGQLDHRYAGTTFENLSRAVDAVQGAPDAAQATADVATAIKPGFGDDGFGFTGQGANGAIAHTVGDGHSPALAIEMARQLKADGNPNADAIISSVVHGAEQLQSKAEGDLKDYAGKTEELSWLIKNEGGVMTPAQLKQAIAQYKADQVKNDPDWEKNIQKAQDKVVADGETLAATIAALQNLPPELRNDNTARAVNDLRTHVGGSQTTQDVLSFAIDQDPALMKGEQGKGVVDFYSGMNLAGKGRTFFGKLVNNYVAQTLLPRVRDVDPNHPETIASAKEALTELKTEWKQGHWSRALGLQGADIDTVIKNVEASLPHEGDTVTSVSKRLETLDGQLNATKGLARNTAAGSIFRAFGFATNAAWFAGSVSSSGKPVEATIGSLAAAVGMSQSAADFGASINLLDADGSLAKWGAGASTAGKLASKFVAWAAVGLSADAAVRSFASGDVPAGILNTTAAGGGAIAILFADTAWGGPVGLAIGAASVVGLGIYGHVKEANKHENARTVQFLKDAGFSDNAAKALSDQSGNGYSPVPLLVQYAKDKGYNMSDPTQRQQVVAWVNGMSSSELSAVRDWMHHTLDDFHGDVGKLGADATPVWPTTPVVTIGAAAEVHVTPHTVGAMDGMMKTYGVTPLPVA